MDSPTTIRGWLILLPEIDGCPPWMETPYLDSPCDDLAAAVAHVYMEAPPKWEQFWFGVSIYLDGDEFPSANSDDCMRGYDAAKAAFKAQKQPKPIEQDESTPTVTEGFVSLPWDQYERLRIDAAAFHTSLTGDLLELQRKAAAYDLMDAQQAILMQAIAKWGEESQMGMAIEECGEMLVETNAALSRFIVACRKVSRVGGREVKPEAKEKLIDETADVFVVMRQMAIMLGRDAVNERIAFKIDRLKGRLEK